MIVSLALLWFVIVNLYRTKFDHQLVEVDVYHLRFLVGIQSTTTLERKKHLPNKVKMFYIC